MTIETITPQELEQRRRAGRPVDLIDVRTPAEYRQVHAEPARLVPLDQLDPAALMPPRDAAGSEPLYVICRTGGRARRACERLAAAGHPHVVNVEGGTDAWERAGLPVVRGRAAIALERQVRIAAGTLVLVGTLLGVLVSPYLLGIAAFVGAGLVFSGVTDTCGMAMLLARMPWNQAGGGSPPACSIAAPGPDASA